MSEEFTVHTPGDPITDPGTATVSVPDAAPVEAAAPAPDPAPAPPAKPGRVTVASLQARVDELELALAQAEAQNRDLIEQNLELKERLGDAGDGPRCELVEKRPTPIVGRDWRQHTSAEAHAAGVREVVLCSDGYYTPQLTPAA